MHRVPWFSAILVVALYLPIASAQADDKPGKKIYKVGDTFTDHTGKVMAYIPSGTYMMGHNRDNDEDGRPAHKVTLTKGFWLDTHEVTRSDFAKCVKAKVCVWSLRERRFPIRVKPGGIKANAGNKYCGRYQFRKPGNHPLDCVDFHEARHYCEEWRGGRLATEAEWERAGRGGLKNKRYPWGKEHPSRKRARYGSLTGTVAVGTYPPNAFGLYDMAGNVWEWTDDWYDRRYYRHSPVIDPRGPCPGKSRCRGFHHRTMRGAGWMSGGVALRVTFRNHHKTYNRFTVVGVRCAKDL
jgi:formylglycine-generating enzyme required for sulfatase activity